jgi:hypothetical protein
LAELAAPEARVLFTRYRLVAPELDLSVKANRDTFKRYVLYRYGGEMQLARTVEDRDQQEGTHHVTLQDMVNSLARSKDAAAIAGKSEDLKLLDSLESFYRQSEVFQVAGSELVTSWKTAPISGVA